MRRTIASLAAGLLLAAALAGCGSDANGGSSGSDAANEPIVVTFEGGDVTPKGERVTVNQGEVTFTVTADVAGAIHVHSSPEQEFDYEAGTHDYTVALDTPGVVEVESHDLDVVIVQLEVN